MTHFIEPHHIAAAERAMDFAYQGDIQRARACCRTDAAIRAAYNMNPKRAAELWPDEVAGFR